MSLDCRVRVRFLLALALPLISCASLGAPGAPTRSNLGRGMSVSATAYCLNGTTASGEETRPGIVAADPRVLPLGTRIRINGLRQPDTVVYKVSDVGPAIKGREIDIYMPSCLEAIRFGRQHVHVRLLAD
jgi:3D (Asp-Asp-Asp) domain-containing protein